MMQHNLDPHPTTKDKTPPYIIAPRLIDASPHIIEHDIDEDSKSQTSLDAFKRVEGAFEGAAKAAGFNSEEEMQAYMKEIRKEIRG